jgi:aminopeptidase-like protein
MTAWPLRTLTEIEGIGERVYAFAEHLYPICRSITGDGVRRTLAAVSEHIPLDVHEVPTGTPVFDWTVPKEWNIREAWIRGPDGRKVLDFADCNLHVLNYSVPVHERLSLADLRPHLISLPKQPDLVPYRTSYYRETWGFCLPHRLLESLPEGEYEVFIDSTLAAGHLSYGEHVLPGAVSDEVLITAHVCHPSLANDNLSGIGLLTFLAAELAKIEHRYTYRFLLIPGTIGSITWLARNEDRVGRIRHGLVLSCLGDGGGPTYKASRRGDAAVDRAAAHVLSAHFPAPRLEPFSPYGYDERQFCSPGFDLPVGLLERSKYGEFPEYHTSADNLDFISPARLEESFQMIVRILDVLENDRRYESRNPKCEPQLGKRGLYQAIGGDRDAARKQMAMLWALNLADGEHSVLDMAQRAGIPFGIMSDTCDVLEDARLIERRHE